MKTLKIFSDGGARGNPGPAATGVVIKDEQGLTLFKYGRFLGTTTNNVAEYCAVIDGLERTLEIVQKNGVEQIEVMVDSQLVAQQLSGAFKVKNAKLKPLFLKVKQLELLLPKVFYHQISRGQNKEADFLVNKTLNLQHGIKKIT